MLEPLHFLTDALAGEQEVTASAIRPILKHIEDICLPQDGDHPLTKEIKTSIIQDSSTRYQPAMISSLLDSTFLDPRFKADFTIDKDLVISDLQYEIVDRSSVDELPQSESQPESSDTSYSHSTEVETPPPVKKMK